MVFVEGRFLLAAALLHLALPVAAAIAPVPERTRPPTARLAPQSAEIDVDVDMLRLPAAVRVPLEADRLPVGEPQPVVAERGSVDRPTERPSPLPSDTSDPVADPPPDDPGSVMTVGPEPGPDQDMMRPPSEADLGGSGIPGMGGTPVWKYPGVLPSQPSRGSAAPTRAPARHFDERQARRVIDSAVRAKDAKLGLDLPAASAVAAAVRDALRASDAPYDCSGSFSVTLGPQGNVTAVTLLSYVGGDAGTWQTVRRTALARLAGKSFPMKASFAKGAIVSVSLRSEQKAAGGGTGRSGATLSFDVTDAVARPARVVSVGFAAKPIE